MNKDIGQNLTVQIPCFEAVGAEGVDIQSIKPASKADLESGSVTIQIFNSFGRVTEQYAWVLADDYMGDVEQPVDGWYNEDWDTLITKKFDIGEGFKVYSSAEGVTFTYAGEVLAAQTVVPVRQNLSAQGNIRPVPVDIQKIIPAAIEGELESGMITIQVINNFGRVVEQYVWVLADDYMGEEEVPVDGWYNEDWDTLVEKTFEPGEGFLVYAGTACTLTFPALSL